ncbi:MAG: hypothetical protein HUU15_14970 [Candidatus Brocadiae bacterium]|nr:hypothetical protein [Candidatus Brocadiia bacterium]
MTWPNVTALRYLESTGQLTPETRARFETAIAAGWQRLLTFEVAGGGFDWYAGGTAKTLLTAYGVLLLADIERVHPVDPAVLRRAHALLASRQNADGTWTIDQPAHTWRQLANSSLPVTAYVVWAFREAGIDDEVRRRGETWLRANRGGAGDPYLVALCSLALGNADPRLEQSVRREGNLAFWPTEAQGVFLARGDGASVESTAMAALALSRAGHPLGAEAVAWLAGKRDPQGAWGSTQATVLSLKALLESSTSKPPERPVTVRLRVNGKEIPGAFRPVTAENHDVMQQVAVPVLEGENTVELETDGALAASWQASAGFWVPWDLAPRPETPALSIEIAWDRTELDLHETLHATATMRSRGPETFMVILDLPVPPGFSPEPAEFERLVEAGTIDRFSITGTQITVYLGRVPAEGTFAIRWSLRPRFPLRAQSGRIGCYEYYTPENAAQEGPRRIRVKEAR